MYIRQKVSNYKENKTWTKITQIYLNSSDINQKTHINHDKGLTLVKVKLAQWCAILQNVKLQFWVSIIVLIARVTSADGQVYDFTH